MTRHSWLRTAALLGLALAGFGAYVLVRGSTSGGAGARSPASVAPRRIVALGQTGVYETLLDFDAFDFIVAVPQLCEYPGSEAKIHLQTSEDGAPNVEAVLAIEPDLVIVKETSRALLERVGLRVVGVPVEDGFDALDRFVLELGDALAAPQRARELVERMRTGRERVARRVAGLKPVRVYYEHPSGYRTYGKGSFADELLTLCGAVNIAGELAQPRPTVNAEFVVAADPDVIVLGAFAGTVEEALARPGWRTLSAARSGRIFRIEPDDRLLWSTRFVERAERLLLPELHPELAR